jgi:hypothetical protein
MVVNAGAGRLHFNFNLSQRTQAMDMIHLDQKVITRGNELLNFDTCDDQKMEGFPRGSQRTLRRLMDELHYYCDLYNEQMEGSRNHDLMINSVTMVASWLIPTTRLVRRCYVVFRKEREPHKYPGQPLTPAENCFLEDAKLVFDLMRGFATGMIKAPGPSAVRYDRDQLRVIRVKRLQLSIRICDIATQLLVDAEGKDSRRIGVWNRVQARALREYGKAVTELAKNYEHTSNGCQSDSEEVAELRDLSMTQRR